MDIGMREILIVLGCIIMAVLFFDAYRRVRDHRRSQFGHRLQESGRPNTDGLQGFDDDELLDDEPLTPVRPVERRDGPIGQGHLGQAKRSQAPTPAQIRVRISQPKGEGAPRTQEPASEPTEPNFAASKAQSSEAASPELELKPTRAGKRKRTDERFDLQSRKSDAPMKALLQPALAAAPESGDLYSNRRKSQASVSARKQQEERERQETKSEPKSDPVEVIVMHVAAQKDEVFEGEILVQQLLALNLRHGDMKIFHRYERPEQHQGLLFSMANMVKPGYFELDHMNAFDTPGVTFFLSLPCDGGALYAFDLMVDTARKLAKDLDGELRDETQSMITAQTVEHYRQRVMEFERKQRMLEKTRQIRERSKLFE